MTPLDVVGMSAYVWWKNLRPAQWTIHEHLDQPTVNTHGADEYDLAICVANWVRTTGYDLAKGGE